MTRPLRSALTALVLGLASCAGAQPEPPAGYHDDATDNRRPIRTERDGRWAGYGVSFGPFREGQSPTGVQPTVEQLREDLLLLDPHFDLIRVYGTDGRTEDILRIIREEGLGLRVMLGAWLGRDMSTPNQMAGGNRLEGERVEIDYQGRYANRAQSARAVELANAYPDVVWAINVGNETQVYWSDHRLAMDRLIEHIKWVRGHTDVPVTTADDYNFWNKPESRAVSRECDFIALHAYAMWNSQTLEDSIAWTVEQFRVVRGLHGEDLPIVITEAGWGTSMVDYGLQSELIVAEAGLEPQVEFTKRFLSWAEENRVVHFLFEAFDEPWKGGDDPREIEKNWGLWYESREPKPAAEWLMEHSPRLDEIERSGG
ncbi:MAG: hypothetical protein ACF8Q5_01050 [Phycisphaerales bacterium JB040]